VTRNAERGHAALLSVLPRSQVRKAGLEKKSSTPAARPARVTGKNSFISETPITMAVAVYVNVGNLVSMPSTSKATAMADSHREQRDQYLCYSALARHGLVWRSDFVCLGQTKSSNTRFIRQTHRQQLCDESRPGREDRRKWTADALQLGYRLVWTSAVRTEVVTVGATVVSYDSKKELVANEGRHVESHPVAICSDGILYL